MRLRITVKRHGLPETPIVWNVDRETATISQLLEQVNEVVPLESGEWGLEDYAVDLKGSNGVNFECLHFQPVGKVMKEDDEVIIRPLLTQDLKIRRISGRFQISADGKHLVDGLAFGRPLLRRPADRPSVNIPPRKRRRVTYNKDEEDDEGFLALKEKEETQNDVSNTEANNRQLVLHADFDDDDSEDDEDFIPGEDEELEDLDDLDGAGVDTDGTDDASSGDDEHEEGEKQEESTSKPQNVEGEPDDLEEAVFADISDDTIRAKIRKLHSAFPNSPLGVCKHVFEGSGGNLDEAYDAMALGFEPVKSKSAITEASQASLSVPKTRSKARKRSAQEMERPDSMQVEANETAESLLDYYDRNGLPGGSIISGNALSHMAKALQNSLGQSPPTSKRSNSGLSTKSVKFALDEELSKGLTSTPHIDQQSHEGSEEESEDTSEDETSSSGTSSSDEDSSSSEDDSDDDEVSETSSSGSDSDSDSSSDDDAPEETSSKASHAIVSNPATTSTDNVATKPRLPLVGKGQGLVSTKERNKRRRNANVLNRFKNKGILPAGTKLVEFLQLKEKNINEETSPEDALAALEELRAANASAELREPTGKASAKADQFEARRQALFASLALGGIEVRPETSLKVSKTNPIDGRETPVKVKEPPETHASDERQQVASEFSTAPENHHTTSAEETSQPQAKVQAAGLPSPTVPKEATADASTSKLKPPTPCSESTQSSVTPLRRAKLDLGAGRRLLFGALGIKTPKSKKDEEKLRSELMKDVRPVYTPKSTEKSPSNANDETADENPDAWREKIIYRAVECCHDGIELSEPPFPFVQRWDPQQQGAWSQKGNRGGKRKKDQRDQEQYYQDDQQAWKKQKRGKGKNSHAEGQEYLNASYDPNCQEDSMITEYEDATQQTRLPSDDVEGDVDQQLMNDLKDNETAGVSQGPEDLVPLPDDPTTLPDLLDGQVKPGMTIAFKQLTMSEETKWQPEISAYRTAIVLASSDDGEIHLELALRDRSRSEKYYDVETGERIYGKFDMPDQDEEEDEPADDGMLFVSFSELVHPKVLQDAPANLDLDATMDGSDEPILQGIGPSIDETADAAVALELALPKTGLSTNGSITLIHEDGSAEAQLSHVTETSLNSDAPESNLPESNNEEWVESTNPRPGLPEDEPSTQTANNDVADQVATPRQHRDATPATSTNTSMEPISDDARLKIIHMMKDAGFRSSVPSSVLKELRPDGMETPGDAAVFEKLMKDMTEIENQPQYSPKFNGLGSSSPIKKLRQHTGSASREPSSSPVRVQSSWQTVDSDEAISPPLMNDDDGSSWQTLDPTEKSSSPHVGVLSKGKPKKTVPAPRKFAALGRAQELWKALQPQAHRTGTASTEKSSNSSPEPITGSDRVDPGGNIQYPKLSVGSSFNSQISDHGRQPDINFDDSAGLSTDTPKVSALEDESFMIRTEDPISDVDQELPTHKSTSSSAEEQSDDPTSDSESDARSSDDSLPGLENVISQRPTKQEKTPRMPSKASTKSDEDYEKATKDFADLSEDEDRTPKASQNHTRRSSGWKSQSSASQPLHPQARRSSSRVSQSRVSQSQLTTFSIPKGSQVMDLTMSSDAEPEAGDDDDEIEPPKKSFRKYSLEDDDDEEYEEEGGWVSKKLGSLRGVGSRRQTDVGLNASSQSSLNTTRRKTTARF